MRISSFGKQLRSGGDLIMNNFFSTSGPRRLLVSLMAITALTAVGCSSGSDSADTNKPAEKSTTTAAANQSTTAPAKDVLKILVSNDDGYNAPGIDAVVRALVAMPDTEVVVSAPATQQSGKGSKVTDGELKSSEQKTLSGHAVFAVEGTPADSVNWALDGGVDMKPDLVITGINSGQNLGSIADQISGTVGAARAATSRGIPALATSMGSDSETNVNEVINVDAFETAAKFVADWVGEHRDGLLEGKYKGDTPLLENMNIPICAVGQPRGVAQVELAQTNQYAIAPQDCQSTLAQPADDITAFNNGFVTISSVPLVSAGG